MNRRLAILDDNHERLSRRLAALGALLPPLIACRACAAIVIGSVAEGRARAALARGIPLWDPEHLLHDEPEAAA